jgi:NAD(P)-dependent dehydrogenase (short-subunit alcohol dehydrogenase family)
MRQKTPEEIRQSIASSSPVGRLATAEDIAKVAVFLASDASNYINGTSINVDAGRSAGL